MINEPLPTLTSQTTGHVTTMALGVVYINSSCAFTLSLCCESVTGSKWQILIRLIWQNLAQNFLTKLLARDFKVSGGSVLWFIAFISECNIHNTHRDNRLNEPALLCQSAVTSLRSGSHGSSRKRETSAGRLPLSVSRDSEA